MIRKIALVATAGLLATGVAFAQNSPPPGNVNPGSQKSGAEESGAPNQPRSRDGMQQQRGTTGSGMTAPSPRATKDQGINANTNPASKESGSEPAGEPANQRR